MSLQSEEMRRYFTSHGILQSEIAEALGLSKQAVSNLLAGRDNIGLKRARRLNEVYGFDINFLMTAEGTLLPPAGSRKVETATGSTFTMGDHSPITSADAELLRKENAQLQFRVELLQKDIEFYQGVIKRLTENLQSACKGK